MSKAEKAHATASAGASDHAEFREKVLARAIERTLLAHDAQIKQELDSLSGDAQFRGWPLPPTVRQFVENQTEWLCDAVPRCHDADDRRDMLRNAVASGFMFAVERYMHVLGEVPELQGLKAKESRRKVKSSTGKRAAKQKRVIEAQQMLDAGIEIEDVAAHFGRSKATVYRWLKSAQPD